jgi:hypothetical protein
MATDVRRHLLGQHKALLLGAGFSVELRMPLVKELTSMLRTFMSDDNLSTLSKNFRRWLVPPPHWINRGLEELDPEQMHYEKFVGRVEDQIVSDALPMAVAYGEYSLEESVAYRLWLVELVNWALLLKHLNVEYSIVTGAVYYTGITRLLPDDHPLWVISLNHDVCFEVVASVVDMPIATYAPAFHPPANQHPRDPLKVIPNEIREDEIRSDLNYFVAGQRGINLLKLHGSLNEFVIKQQDGTSRLVHMSPSPRTPRNWIHMLEDLNSEPWGKGSQTVPLNHISRQDNEDRYLMRTVLTGSHKMADLKLLHSTFGGPAIASPADDRAMPFIFHRPEMSRPLREKYTKSMFDVLDSVLPGIEHLITIGYSLGDDHVNQRIHKWMLGNPDARLSIVKPRIKKVPPFLRDVADNRVELICMGTTRYLNALME